MTTNFIKKFSHAVGNIYYQETFNKPILIGKDTRKSCKIIERIIANNLQKLGINVRLAGVLPSPGMSKLLELGSYSLGIMITASHNPSPDNGFKIFSGKGEKLSVEQEKFIESVLDRSLLLPEKRKLPSEKPDLVQGYLGRLMALFPENFLEGLKIVADLANGATIETTTKALSRFGAQVYAVNEGEGIINERAGSEHPELMQKRVKETGADFGLAHDGDGDRVIFADGSGRLVHGDQLLGLLALDAKKEGYLKGKALVATEHSNSGLQASLSKESIDLFRSQVGDRNVALLMKEKNCNLGGESSGHVVARDYLPTGDGLYTALLVSNAIVRSGRTIENLAQAITLWPSRVGSFPVDEKIPLDEIPELADEIGRANERLGRTGRILLRYSGTEPKIRLLVESEDQKLAEEIFVGLGDAIEKIL